MCEGSDSGDSNVLTKRYKKDNGSKKDDGVDRPLKKIKQVTKEDEVKYVSDDLEVEVSDSIKGIVSTPMEGKGHLLFSSLCPLVRVGSSCLFPLTSVLFVSPVEVMDVVNTTNNGAKGKCISFIDATVALNPCTSCVKALSTYCLYGRALVPMSVEDITVKDAILKTWNRPISVVALIESNKNVICFEFGFENVKDRSWALENGPWCVKVYTFALQPWSPRVEGVIPVCFLWLWVQVHHLPHEYFSIANGEVLAALAGKIISSSLYANVFSGAKNFVSKNRTAISITTKAPLVALLSSVGALGTTSPGFLLVLPPSASKSTKKKIATTGPRSVQRSKKLAVWIPKNTFDRRANSNAISGNHVVTVKPVVGKASTILPVVKELGQPRDFELASNFLRLINYSSIDFSSAGSRKGIDAGLPPFFNVGGDAVCWVRLFSSVGPKPIFHGPDCDAHDGLSLSCGEKGVVLSASSLGPVGDRPSSNGPPMVGLAASLGPVELKVLEGSNDSSICGQESNMLVDEERALSNFFQAET
ncbi:hypothetical protein G4B88_002208 [Cannabis sativa]|uniref:DUF4283 domain-containing protein n=1 Tax=Cannabis sativa TaxID=3483 RepID=A0A7J6FYN7_CANSA|nr:hypothetical protein G4B88_002208 [Cannabis sativa]